jgi:hypothetical protein
MAMAGVSPISDQLRNCAQITAPVLPFTLVTQAPRFSATWQVEAWMKWPDAGSYAAERAGRSW